MPITLSQPGVKMSKSYKKGPRFCPHAVVTQQEEPQSVIEQEPVKVPQVVVESAVQEVKVEKKVEKKVETPVIEQPVEVAQEQAVVEDKSDKKKR